MKNLVIKNQGPHPADNQEELDEFLEEGLFSENREIWYWFNTAWHPQNREETLRRFSELKPGDNIICQTVFEDYQQLEILALILMKSETSRGLNFYILHPNLKSEIQSFFDERYSSIEPNTEEFEDYEPRVKYKQSIDTIVKGVLISNNIYNQSVYGSWKPKRLTVEDFNIKEQ